MPTSKERVNDTKKDNKADQQQRPQPRLFRGRIVQAGCVYLIKVLMTFPLKHFPCHLQDVLKAILGSSETLKTIFCNVSMSALSGYDQVSLVLEHLCRSNDTALEVFLSTLNQVTQHDLYTTHTLTHGTLLSAVHCSVHINVLNWR